MDRLLRRLGYWLARQDGSHLVYMHRSQAPFTLPSTPSDHRAYRNDLARLRRRHPDAEPLKRRKSSRPRRRRRATGARGPLSLLMVPATVPEGPPERDGDDCNCGRKWLSDLSPVGRRCPSCDGWVLRP